MLQDSNIVRRIFKVEKIKAAKWWEENTVVSRF